MTPERLAVYYCAFLPVKTVFYELYRFRKVLSIVVSTIYPHRTLRARSGL